MRIPVRIASAALAAACLGACAGASPGDTMVRPGDEVGGILLTTAGEDETVYMTQLHCSVEGTTETCQQPVGSRVNVSQGIVASAGGPTLDEIWASQTYEMTVDGRLVDLDAFGYGEFYHPAAGTVRVWDVVVTTDRPGTVSVQSTGVTQGESWTYTAVVVFAE